MSGIGIAVAAGVTAGAPPLAPLEQHLSWKGVEDNDSGYIVSGASGTTTFPDIFAESHSGGTGGNSTSYPIIVANPSGKLGTSGSGSGRFLTWTGFTVNETEYITVRASVTDSSNTTATADRTVIVKRTS